MACLPPTLCLPALRAMVSRPASYLNFHSFLSLPFCPHPYIPHLILTVTLKNSVFLCITFSLSVDEHLGCFHVLAAVNSAAMDMGVHCLLEYGFLWVYA